MSDKIVKIGKSQDTAHLTCIFLPLLFLVLMIGPLSSPKGGQVYFVDMVMIVSRLARILRIESFLNCQIPNNRRRASGCGA